MDRIGLMSGVAPSAVDQRLSQPASVPGTGARVGENTAMVGASATSTQVSPFARLWQQKEAAITQVQNASERLNRLRQAQDIVTAMRRQIDAWVKNYPPFPPGSEERLQYLRSISALRQQLDALTVPPRQEMASRIPEAPRLPADEASDAQWQAHAEALGVYQTQLAELSAASADRLQRARMWPEVGSAMPSAAAVPDQASLQTLATTLRQSTASLSQAGDLYRSGL